MKKIISILICIMLVIEIITAIGLNNVEAKVNYKKIYAKVIKNNDSVFKYSKSLDYVIGYFGKENIKFDKHFYCDLDKNGTKELFVYDSKLGLVEVFTINKGKVCNLGYDFFYGINKKKKALITKGHWHGAGGSQDKEWWVTKINKKKTKLVWTWYIDKMSNQYSIYKGERDLKQRSQKTQKKLYKKIYKKYIKGVKRKFK